MIIIDELGIWLLNLNFDMYVINILWFNDEGKLHASSPIHMPLKLFFLSHFLSLFFSEQMFVFPFSLLLIDPKFTSIFLFTSKSF